MSLHTTASQTVGPFFAIGMEPLYIAEIAGPGVPGEREEVRGRVFDGDGRPVPDAVIEIWQANAEGSYAHPEATQQQPLSPGFRGFGRVPTGEEGEFRFSTIKPGRVPGPGDVLQAPHLVVLVYMRGLLKHLVTRMYFPDEASNTTDPILQLVPAERRATLIAHHIDGATQNVLEWNILLQGPDETVFFDA
jgi:protocatechuate 3,4-dioxygenase, alpha subunit